MLKQLKKMFGTRDAPQTRVSLPDDDDDDDRDPAPGADAALLVNAYSTVQALPAPGFPHRLLGRRDAADPALGAHLAGFIAYVESLGEAMTPTRYQVLRHLQRTRHQLSFAVEEAHFNEAASWAESANALLFLPDGHVRDPQARILVSSEDGGAEADAQLPHPPDAWQRKATTESLLAARGLHPPAHLPPVAGEPELVMQNAADVAGRALALFAVAVQAESLAAQAGIPLAALQDKLPGFENYLTPEEQSFLHTATPIDALLAQFSWRYESLCVLEWALGLAPALPWPDQLCASPMLARSLADGGWDALLQSASLRPPGEILDALDLHYRLHWLVRQARVDGRAPPAGLDPGVVLERHHALNWLVRFEDSGWDEVDTPT